MSGVHETWRCAATPPFTSGCANVVAVAAVAVAAVAASDTAATAAEGEEEEEYTRLVVKGFAVAFRV